MNRDIKIGFLTTTDPNDRKSWSGTHSALFETLKKHFEHVIPIGPLDGGLPMKIGRLKSLLFRIFFRKRYDYSHSKSLSLHYAKIIEKRLENIQLDIIFAPTASTPIAFLNTKIPIISLSDATVKTLLGYYDSYKNLTASSEIEALDIERRNIKKSSLCLYASEWAAQSALNDFGAENDKIKVVPMGANLHLIPNKEELNFNGKMETIHFLFLGVEWERKGGPLVIETLNKLNHLGINVFLTICGCQPKFDAKFPFEVIPFVNKNNPEGEKKLSSLFQKSHFLFVPSKAECYGMVFCEASAFGVPSLTYETGGIGGAVVNGVNGFMVKKFESDEFLRIILDLVNNEEKYIALCKSSRELFDTKLNWSAWLKTVAPLIENLAKSQK